MAEVSHEPSLLTVPEAARYLRISRNLAYELVRQERLPHVHLGKRVLIPRYQLEQWVASEARGAEAARS